MVPKNKCTGWYFLVYNIKNHAICLPLKINPSPLKNILWKSLFMLLSLLENCLQIFYYTNLILTCCLPEYFVCKHRENEMNSLPPPPTPQPLEILPSYNSYGWVGVKNILSLFARIKLPSTTVLKGILWCDFYQTWSECWGVFCFRVPLLFQKMNWNEKAGDKSQLLHKINENPQNDCSPFKLTLNCFLPKQHTKKNKTKYYIS